MLHYHLRRIVSQFKVLGLDEDNNELFERFINLKKKFPDSKRSFEI